jgi:hypothetical protein
MNDGVNDGPWFNFGFYRIIVKSRWKKIKEHPHWPCVKTAETRTSQIPTTYTTMQISKILIFFKGHIKTKPVSESQKSVFYKLVISHHVWGLVTQSNAKILDGNQRAYLCLESAL